MPCIQESVDPIQPNLLVAEHGTPPRRARCHRHEQQFWGDLAESALLSLWQKIKTIVPQAESASQLGMVAELRLF